MNAHGDLPTTVEMLWEQRDPRVVLRDRFGFSDTAEAVEWVSRVLSDEYGEHVAQCERLVLSAGNALAWVRASGGTRLIVKWSIDARQFPRLESLARITRWLDQQGLPVSPPVPSRDGRLQVERDEVSLGVQRVIAGDLLDVESDDQVWAAGALLARLHLALDECTAARDLQPRQAPVPWRTQVTDGLQAPPSHLPQQTIQELLRLLGDAGDEPATLQLVHGDFRSANVLWDGSRISAVLDFEEARWDSRVSELARTGVLLGTQYHDWGPVSDHVRRQLRAGYESIRPLSPAEEQWLAVLTLWHSLQFVPEDADPTGWGDAALSQLPSGTTRVCYG